MKEFRKIILRLAVSVMIGVCSVSPIVSFAATTEVEPRADIIEWRYKTENGKIYRRQYNYSKQVWVGEWEFIANVVG